ncbi:MAG: M23 family metallopeptidase [Castellaniella sp.]
MRAEMRTAAGGRFAYRRRLVLALPLLLAACAGKSRRAPGSATAPAAGVGEYRVMRGDTLTRIARQHGQTVASLMQMNGIRNPNHIRVGQILRVRGGAPAGTMSSASTVEAPAVARTSSVAAPRSIHLSWPAEGRRRRGTTEGRTQGVYIAGAAGSPVKAAAAGEVVFAGQGPRGYGNLLLVRHDANFISVYAHNDRLLVKLGAHVKQGQQIATMGNSSSNEVHLYFELRYDSKAVDAMRYLPA